MIVIVGIQNDVFTMPWSKPTRRYFFENGFIKFLYTKSDNHSMYLHDCDLAIGKYLLIQLMWHNVTNYDGPYCWASFVIWGKNRQVKKYYHTGQETF